eukprot:6483409-Pyramimonas_sp.AAC.1
MVPGPPGAGRAHPRPHRGATPLVGRPLRTPCGYEQLVAAPAAGDHKPTAVHIPPPGSPTEPAQRYISRDGLWPQPRRPPPTQNQLLDRPNRPKRPIERTSERSDAKRTPTGRE